MAKKILLVLILAAFAAGLVFAQSEQTEQTKQTGFAQMAKNTITVDVGPTIMGAIIGLTGDMLGGGGGLSSSGFGIGAQYERQIFQKFSVAGRFTYLGGSLGFSNSETDSGVDLKTSLGIDLSSYSIEGHARFYPSGETFFLDGMLGYANMTVKFSGTMVGKDEASGQKREESVNMDASQGFFLLGAKIGWRISFGKNGGFTFEPAFGYSLGIGIGDKVGDQLSKQVKNKSGVDIDSDNFNLLFTLLQDYIFIGGPRLSLAFGWRF